MTNKPEERQDRPKTHRVIALLNREQVDFLDEIGKDALFSTGAKLSRTKIIFAVVNALRTLGITGEGIRSREELEQKIVKAKADYPDAEFIAHPECRPDVLQHADAIRSTAGMMEAVRQSSARRFIVGTEEGMLHKLRKDHPDREFILPTPKLVCPTMKMTKLASLVRSLERMEYEITVTGEVAARAKEALDRMLSLTRESPMAAIAGY